MMNTLHDFTNYIEGLKASTDLCLELCEKKQWDELKNMLLLMQKKQQNSEHYKEFLEKLLSQK